MSIGLYQQFDLHPGKLINGEPINSGLRFYYWTQSFGRYTGENHFNEMNHFTFLLENMIWSFLPWIFFFLIGLVFALKDLVMSKFRLAANEEWISTGGFIITYCILARSQAQLPHYIFVVFPLAAIVTAKFLYRLLFTDALLKWKNTLLIFHSFIFVLLWIAAILLMAWPFETVPKFVAVLAGLGLLTFFWILFSKNNQFPVLLSIAFFTVTGVNVFLSTAFYPNVLKYQLGNDAAAFIDRQKIDKDKIRIYGTHEGRAFHFYGKHIFPEKQQLQDLHADNIVLTSKDSLSVFQKAFPEMKILHEGPHFGVTALSLPFLNPATRDKEVPKYLLISLNGKP